MLSLIPRTFHVPLSPTCNLTCNSTCNFTCNSTCNLTPQVLLVYGRGTGVTDTRLVVKEVGSERTLQEVVVGKPVLDIQVRGDAASRWGIPR